MAKEKKLPWHKRQEILNRCADRQAQQKARKEKKVSNSMYTEIMEGDFQSVTKGKSISTYVKKA